VCCSVARMLGLQCGLLLLCVLLLDASDVDVDMCMLAARDCSSLTQACIVIESMTGSCTTCLVFGSTFQQALGL